jgi:YVTN family beta-propeller protein
MLGPLEVLRNGDDVTLGGARQQALLAALLIRANEVVSSERLIDELWGEQPPGTAATALHGFVSTLRKALEPDRVSGAPGTVLVTRAPGYLLRVEPGTLDAARFEHLWLDGREALAAGDAKRASELLRSALGLWRGPALAGVDGASWAHAEAHRLDELRLEALEDRIEADLALGRDGALVSELEALVAREPLRERPRGQLMLALYRAGRQAEALELYQNTRRIFVEQLGIEPTPRLRELERAILVHDPELEAGLPRLRPPAVLRRRSRRVLLGAAAVGAIAILAAAGILVLRDGDAAVATAPGSVAVVDAKSGRVIDSVEVGSGPVAIVSGHDSLWVANSEDDTVSRIDAATHEVEATIGVPSPVDLAVGPDAIWVASGIAGTVSRIDPESNDVVATIDLRSSDPFDARTVHGIASGEGAVWAAVTGSRLAQIDTVDNRVARWIDVGSDQLAAAAGHGALWVATTRGRLVRVEPATGAVTAQLPIGSAGSFPSDVVLADDGVLVLAGDVWLVDPATARLNRTLSLGAYLTAVADEPGPGLWVVTWDGALARLDPLLAESSARVQVGEHSRAVAVASGAVWAAIGDPEG